MRRFTVAITFAILAGLSLTGCQDSQASFSKLSREEQKKAFEGDKTKALEMQAKFKAQYGGANSSSRPRNLPGGNGQPATGTTPTAQ